MTAGRRRHPAGAAPPPSGWVPWTEVAPSPLHGLGVFAARRFRAGELVAVYDGAELDPSCVPDLRSTMVMCLVSSADGSRRYVDGRFGGQQGMAQYINHAAGGEANAECGLDWRIVALRTIQRGSEILYDYGGDYWDGGDGAPEEDHHHHAAQRRRES